MNARREVWLLVFSLFGIGIGAWVLALEIADDALRDRECGSADDPGLDVGLDAEQYVDDLLPHAPLLRRRGKPDLEPFVGQLARKHMRTTDRSAVANDEHENSVSQTL